MNKYNDEDYEAYYYGRMKKPEQRAFKEALSDDPALKQVYDTYKSLRKVQEKEAFEEHRYMFEDGQSEDVSKDFTPLEESELEASRKGEWVIPETTISAVDPSEIVTSKAKVRDLPGRSRPRTWWYGVAAAGLLLLAVIFNPFEQAYNSSDFLSELKTEQTISIFLDNNLTAPKGDAALATSIFQDEPAWREALLALKSENYAEAERKLKALKKQIPEKWNDQLSAKRALLLTLMPQANNSGKRKEAIRMLMEMREGLNPEGRLYTSLSLELARLYALNKEDYAKAITILEELIKVGADEKVNGKAKDLLKVLS